MEDDLTLWKNIRDGDALSLKVLHNRYYYSMCLFAKKYNYSQQILEEAVSDCFIKLWTKKDDIIIEHSVKSYLFLILRNGLTDISRKKNRILPFEISSLPDLTDGETLNNFDQFTSLYNALDKLPEQRRRILELAVFDSCSYIQIADKLQISINTVKTQMGRAYRFLREELDYKSFQLFFLLKTSHN